MIFVSVGGTISQREGGEKRREPARKQRIDEQKEIKILTFYQSFAISKDHSN